MNKVILDAELRAKLGGLCEPLEICDKHGQPVAHVTPVLDATRCEPLVPELNIDEMQRRAASDEPRYSTAKVLNHLGSL